MNNLDITEPTPSGQPDEGRDGGHLLPRRRLLQLGGSAVLGGVALSILSACSTSSQTNGDAMPGTTSPNSDAPADPSATVAPDTQPPATLPRVTAGSVPGTDPAATIAPSAQMAVIDGTLPIPPLLTPEERSGVKAFRLTAQKGESHFVPDQPTATFGFNGNYLGPTLRAGRGDRVLIDVTNQLGETSTVHWHGMHLPAAMDGGPRQTIADGATWSPEFTIQQPAATLWYHPHVMGETLRHVGMGLVGLFILDDTDPVHNDLPHAYGIDDIPLILQAKTFGADGQFVLNGGGGGGGGGGGDGETTTLVNGAISPAINTADSRLRFRVLNASSEESYNLGFAGDETFYQVASDGGLLSAPVPMTRLQLAPAERAEIVVDINPSAPMVLQGFGGNGGGRGGNDFQAGPLLTINPTQTTDPQPPLPATLTVIERLLPETATQTRDFVLGGNGRNPTINGQSMTSEADLMDMTDVIQVKLGSTEIWNVINRSDDAHVFHVHDIQFQIVQRNDAPPPPNESGFKDTVMVSPFETVRLIMQFTDFSDPSTPYLYHCHLLDHEDDGMMGEFLVV